MAFIDRTNTHYECSICKADCYIKLHKTKENNIILSYWHPGNFSFFINNYPAICKNSGKILKETEINIIHRSNIKDHQSMELLYIAAPYRAATTAQIQNNIYEASLMAQYYWLQGYAVICPHLNSANFDGLVPDEQFLKATMMMFATCKHIALHPRWPSSQGCIDEACYAYDHNITQHFTDMLKVYKKLGLTIKDN